jgi:hypothetical protein
VPEEVLFYAPTTIPNPCAYDRVGDKHCYDLYKIVRRSRN